MARPKLLHDSARSLVISVRMDQKLHFIASRVAAKRHMPLSSYIEHVLERAIDDEVVSVQYDERKQKRTEVKARTFLAKVWSADPITRYARIWTDFPEMLNSYENDLTDLIDRCPGLWKKYIKRSVEDLDVDMLRKHWDALNAVAREDSDEESLPAEIFDK